MAQKVVKVGVKKEKGWLYFVDKNGDISRAKMARGGRKVKKRAKKKKPAKRKAPKRKSAKRKKKPVKRKPAKRKRRR